MEQNNFFNELDTIFQTGDIREAEAANYFEQALELVRENYGENKSYSEVLKNLEKVRKRLGSLNMRMTGMGLAESFFDEYGRKMGFTGKTSGCKIPAGAAGFTAGC